MRSGDRIERVGRGRGSGEVISHRFVPGRVSTRGAINTNLGKQGSRGRGHVVSFTSLLMPCRAAAREPAGTIGMSGAGSDRQISKPRL